MALKRSRHTSNVAAAPPLGGAGAGCAPRGEGLDLRRMDVVPAQGKAVLEEIERHCPPHVAESDEPTRQGHAVPLSYNCLGGRAARGPPAFVRLPVA